MNADAPLKRADVPSEQAWSPERVYASWEEWEAGLNAVSEALPELQSYECRLSEGPTVLADWLEQMTDQRRRLGRLMVYARIASDVDSHDDTAQGKLSRVSDVSSQFAAAVAFAEPEMLELGDTLLEWADAEPRLGDYRHYFRDLLRRQGHMRSADVEEVLGMLGDPFGGPLQTFQQLSTSDLQFDDAVDSSGQRHPVGQATLPPRGIQSPDRQRRRTAWESFCDGYRQMENTFASNYLTRVKQAVFQTRVRGYDSVLHSRLEPFNVPTDVFHNLMDTFQRNLSVWHRYWDVKRRALGLDELHPYDIWAPLTDHPPTIPFDDAIDMIADSVAPLGDDYASTLRKGCLEEGWVDYAPNEGKVQGAHSSPCHGNPPYIVIGYDDTLQGASILTHELGHSMHAYLIDQNQPEIYNGLAGKLSSTVTETASNLHQALLRAHLLAERGDDERFQLALVDEAMFNFHRYFFIMPTLARFEQAVHTRAQDGQPLTAASLNEIMGDCFAEGYGETMSDDPERTAVTWAQFIHLYIPFYSFQYAVGISAANALAQNVLHGSSTDVDNYLTFLRAGSSQDTMDLFNTAGVDMATPDPIEQAFEVLSGFVDRLEELTT
ncbi:MAG: oligoendopeptidase F [Candidatus Bipolaricaulia bacterium]